MNTPLIPPLLLPLSTGPIAAFLGGSCPIILFRILFFFVACAAEVNDLRIYRATELLTLFYFLRFFSHGR